MDGCDYEHCSRSSGNGCRVCSWRLCHIVDTPLQSDDCICVMMMSSLMMMSIVRQHVIYKLSLLTPHSTAVLFSTPPRCVRSTNCHLLAVTPCTKSSFASRAFCVSSPNNWNSFPLHIRSSDSLKSHLFSSADHV